TAGVEGGIACWVADVVARGWPAVYERACGVDTGAAVLADEHRMGELPAVGIVRAGVDAVRVVRIGVDDVCLALQPDSQLEKVAWHAVAAELATGHAGDAAAVDEGLAREHRLGEGGLSREPVECLCEVDAPLAVRVGRPVAAVVRPRVERARSVPG